MAFMKVLLFCFKVNEQETPQAEISEEKRRDDEMWKKERKLLLDSLTPSKQESTGDETDFVHAWANASWDQNMKYLEQPQRRRGLKWIQTTTETRQIFKIYRSGDHMRKMLNKKREGMSSDEISKGTLTLSSPRCKCQENEESQLDDSPVSKVGDKKVEEMIETFQNEQLQKIYEASRGETTESETKQGGQNEIECDPSARWDVLDIAREGSHIWEYFPKKSVFLETFP